MSEVITIISTGSIQEYIFRSNRLRDNVGGSALLEKAFEDLQKSHPQECVLSKGAQAVLIFASEDQAREAVRKWSGDQMKKGIEARFTAYHQPVDGHWGKAYDEAKCRLAIRESEPPWGSPLQALPLTRTCQASGLAATARDREEWVSTDIAKRRQHQPDNTENKYDYPVELENLGIRDGASQIALVHVDGNGFGRIFSELPGTREEFREELKKLSKEVDNLLGAAFDAMCTALDASITGWQETGIVKIDRKDKPKLLPLRKIVGAGDEATWVCAGRLGMLTAVKFLQELEARAKRSKIEALQKATGCAGVLIMPKGFPFSRAYKLTEELCGQAKTKRRKDGKEGSWLDVHAVIEGHAGSVGETREVYYRDSDGNLLTQERPWRVDEGWEKVQEHWRYFQDWPRSRAKALLQRFPLGYEAVDELVKLYRDQGYPLPSTGSPRELFDALELLDLHAEWQPEGNQ